MSAPHGPRRLAAACRAHAAPVYLETGRFAPQGTYAVWDLPMSKGRAVQIKRYEDDTFTLRILPPEEGGV